MKKNSDHLMVTTWAVPNKDLSQYVGSEDGKTRVRISEKKTVDTFYHGEVARLTEKGIKAWVETRKSPITGLTEIAVFKSVAVEA